jgi:hypothetical protein
MRFSAKDAKDLENEFEEVKIPRTYMANLVDVNQSYITQFINGVRQPSADVLRKMRAVFTMIRAAHMPACVAAVPSEPAATRVGTCELK